MVYVCNFDKRFPFIVPPEKTHKHTIFRLENVISSFEENWNAITRTISTQRPEKTVLRTPQGTRICLCTPTHDEKCLIKIIPAS